MAAVKRQSLPSKEGTIRKFQELAPESQGQNLTLTVLNVPSTLESGLHNFVFNDLALFCSNVDKFVPRTQDVNLRTDRQVDGGQSYMQNVDIYKHNLAPPSKHTELGV